MTTWYTSSYAGGYARRDVKAYSVRPDLWPAGPVAEPIPAADDPGPVYGWLATWLFLGQDTMAWNWPLLDYAVPGTAEALVLGGRVSSPAFGSVVRTDLVWLDRGVRDPG